MKINIIVTYNDIKKRIWITANQKYIGSMLYEKIIPFDDGGGSIEFKKGNIIADVLIPQMIKI